MNSNVLRLAVGVGTVAGVGLASHISSKATGKPLGIPGSMAHTMGNDKLDKKAYAKEYNKEVLKDTAKLGAFTALAAGSAAVATGVSAKAANFATGAKAAMGRAAEAVSVNGKSLKSMITNTNLYKKFNGLQGPAKAAIVVGAAALALGLMIYDRVSIAKSAYIEGKNETV